MNLADMFYTFLVVYPLWHYRREIFNFIASRYYDRKIRQARELMARMQADFELTQPEREAIARERANLEAGNGPKDVWKDQD